MNHTKSIRRIKSLQNQFVKMQEEVFAIIKKVDKDLIPFIQGEWDKIFPGVRVHFLSGLHGGCMTNKWSPQVFFYTFNDLEYHKGKFYDGWGNGKFSRGVVVREKPPIPMKKLREFLKRMSQETGIPCKLVHSSYVDGCLSGRIKEEDYVSDD